MNAAMEIFNKWLSMVDFPATMLLIMVLMGAYVMYKTQKDPHNDFDFADMLRDENGKPSAIRLAILPCLAISSWVIMYLVVQNKSIDLWLLVFYMCVWSGAKIAEKMVDAYVATRGVAMSPLTPQQPPAVQVPVSAPTAPTTITGAAGLVLPVRAK